MLPGLTVVDGNNPYTIQGHPVSTTVEGQSSGIRDYLDLTDQILEIPRELSHYRYDSPLMGGSHTVKNHSGPVNDYLATQYLSTKPDQGYMGPENRPAETPDITIGKGGTIDVRLKSTVFEHDKLAELVDEAGIKGNIIRGVYYNLTDFDDPSAPAYPVSIKDEWFEVRILTPTPVTTMANVRPGSRVVGYVKLTATGEAFVRAHISAFRTVGGNPSELHSKVGWFEILDVGAAGNIVYNLIGATPIRAGACAMIQSPRLPVVARVPPERVWICGKPAIDAKGSRGGYIPVWDITEISSKKDGVNHKTTIKYVKNLVPESIVVTTPVDDREVRTDYRAMPQLPVYSQKFSDANPVLTYHPFFPETVFPPVRVEAFPQTGGRYDANVTELKAATVVGKWKPNTHTRLTFKVGEYDGKTTGIVGYYHDQHMLRRHPGVYDWSVLPRDPLEPFTVCTTNVPPEDKITYKITPLDHAVAVPFNDSTGVVTIDPTIFKTGDRNKSYSFTVECMFSGTTGTVKFDTNTFTIQVPTLLRRVDPVTVEASQTTRVPMYEGELPSDRVVVFVLEGEGLDPTSIDEAGVLTVFGNPGWVGEPFDVQVVMAMEPPTGGVPVEIDRTTVEINVVNKSDVSQVSGPAACTRITASVVRKPCRGPEDLLVVAQFSDGSARELSMSEYQIVRSSSGMMTIAYGDDPDIVTDVSLQ